MVAAMGPRHAANDVVAGIGTLTIIHQRGR
jgi:hypothetical protein